MELGHLLTHSGLTYPEVSSKVYHNSFYQLGSSVSLSWVIYFEAFYLHAVSSFSCIPVICPKLVLFLTPLQFVHLFCVSCCSSHVFHLCCCYSSGATCSADKNNNSRALSCRIHEISRSIYILRGNSVLQKFPALKGFRN